MAATRASLPQRPPTTSHTTNSNANKASLESAPALQEATLQAKLVQKHEQESLIETHAKALLQALRAEKLRARLGADSARVEAMENAEVYSMLALSEAQVSSGMYPVQHSPELPVPRSSLGLLRRTGLAFRHGLLQLVGLILSGSLLAALLSYGVSRTLLPGALRKWYDAEEDSA
jgi:hypothetical protein